MAEDFKKAVKEILKKIEGTPLSEIRKAENETLRQEIFEDYQKYFEKKEETKPAEDKNPLKIPQKYQSIPGSCGLACIRMLLDYYNSELFNNKLNLIMEKEIVKNAAKIPGFGGDEKERLEELALCYVLLEAYANSEIFEGTFVADDNLVSLDILQGASELTSPLNPLKKVYDNTIRLILEWKKQKTPKILKDFLGVFKTPDQLRFLISIILGKNVSFGTPDEYNDYLANQNEDNYNLLKLLIKTQFDKIRDGTALPCIYCLEALHFVVVSGIGGKKLYVLDPFTATRIDEINFAEDISRDVLYFLNIYEEVDFSAFWKILESKIDIKKAIEERRSAVDALKDYIPINETEEFMQLMEDLNKVSLEEAEELIKKIDKRIEELKLLEALSLSLSQDELKVYTELCNSEGSYLTSDKDNVIVGLNLTRLGFNSGKMKITLISFRKKAALMDFGKKDIVIEINYDNFLRNKLLRYVNAGYDKDTKQNMAFIHLTADKRLAEENAGSLLYVEPALYKIKISINGKSFGRELPLPVGVLEEEFEAKPLRVRVLNYKGLKITVEPIKNEGYFITLPEEITKVKVSLEKEGKKITKEVIPEDRKVRITNIENYQSQPYAIYVKGPGEYSVSILDIPPFEIEMPAAKSLGVNLIEILAPVKPISRIKPKAQPRPKELKISAKKLSALEHAVQTEEQEWLIFKKHWDLGIMQLLDKFNQLEFDEKKFSEHKKSYELILKNWKSNWSKYLDNLPENLMELNFDEDWSKYKEFIAIANEIGNKDINGALIFLAKNESKNKEIIEFINSFVNLALLKIWVYYFIFEAAPKKDVNFTVNKLKLLFKQKEEQMKKAAKEILNYLFVDLTSDNENIRLGAFEELKKEQSLKYFKWHYQKKNFKDNYPKFKAILESYFSIFGKIKMLQLDLTENKYEEKRISDLLLTD